ncbi:hypothetical protein [Streptomyces sp. NPDC002463]|uniref:hypothetical protein n=1 Tax=Streptomyces sp. NPDC002463 TaxID=3364645 RepID=UPI00368FCCC4
MADLSRLVDDPAAWAPIHRLAGTLDKTLPGIFATDRPERLEAARRRLTSGSLGEEQDSRVASPAPPRTSAIAVLFENAAGPALKQHARPPAHAALRRHLHGDRTTRSDSLAVPDDLVRQVHFFGPTGPGGV